MKTIIVYYSLGGFTKSLAEKLAAESGADLLELRPVKAYPDIAIQDLTKASDIIRSRTFEAFFPLITTAVIYFIIAWLLTRVLTMLQNRLDPRRKK